MREGRQERPGPRIFYLCARRAGPVGNWNEWLAEAGRLACDWLWLGELQPRRADVHPLATAIPGGVVATAPDAELRNFVAAAHAQGLKLAADFSPAFVDRAAPLAAEHPRWFVTAPAGTPAVPSGMGPQERAATLVECDFGGGCRTELAAYWSGVAAAILRRGFDALVCRAAHRVPAPVWAALLAAAHRVRPQAACWADTLGVDVRAAEALAGVGFDAYFSSACWWDFHGDWFLEQERHLRRLAPTIAFPEEPGGARLAAGVAAAAAEPLARFRYRFAAATAWGVVLPMGYAQGWRRPLGEAGPRERPAFDLGPEIAALNAIKAETPALAGPSRLRRLSAAGADACVLALEPAGTQAPVLALFNSTPDRHAEVRCGPLFADLDTAAARARELTPGRTPQQLDAAARVALEPLAARWFEARRMAPPAAGPDPDPEQDLVALAAAPITIANVTPRVDSGAAIKCTLGAEVTVAADLVADGHGRLGAALCYRGPRDEAWRETVFELVDNDRWQGRFAPDCIGAWRFRIHAWRDRFGSWREECIKRRDAGQTLTAELGEGEALLDEAAAAARDPGEHKHLAALQERLAAHGNDLELCAELLLGDTVAELVARTLPRAGLSASRVFPLSVERGRAGAGAWYECFPRSLGPAARHGTFDDLIAHLPYIAGLGFDVVYLPPIHPIGRTNRKGRNNALTAGPDDPGSPWAIGSAEGGHTAVHPALGTLADFRRVVAAARDLGLEIALDFAIQCAPDHPWIHEHPQWFRWRADGSIRYAENPPKKYEDIVNVDFYGEGREALWTALRDVVLFWCRQGVRIFRVDNPHTKPLPFWEWLITSVRARHPDTVFLSEAFTRPKVMHRLAQIGFSQSYTYFIWRNGKEELIQYLEELAGEPVREYFRPNFWVNTPDINPYYLQDSGRTGFVVRAVLAATMVSSWGMYSGYELCEHEPLRNPDGSAREEYLNSEKYELKHRDFGAPGNICAEVTALNRIRRDNPALRDEANIDFHPANDGAVLFYSRRSPDNVIWVLVSLDPHNPREADLELPLEMLDANENSGISVEDLLGVRRWSWRGRHQRVRLDPQQPAMVLRVTKVD